MFQSFFPWKTVDGIVHPGFGVDSLREIWAPEAFEAIYPPLYLADSQHPQQPEGKGLAGPSPEQRGSLLELVDGNKLHQPFQGLGGSILAYSSRSFRRVTTYTSISIATITAPT